MPPSFSIMFITFMSNCNNIMILFIDSSLPSPSKFPNFTPNNDEFEL